MLTSANFLSILKNMSKQERKTAILSSIIKEYIKTAKPVSSSLIVDKYGFGLSPATIRSEMVNLDNEGLITSPHTSAGRIPTIEGWNYYIDNFINENNVSDKEKGLINNAIKKKSLKEIAKSIAEISSLAVFIGFSENDSYYTGMSNLFRQPEFQQINMVCSISEVVDHIDDVLPNVLNIASDETKILIGQENPFGTDCGTMITKINGKLFGVLGPVRMDYQNNFSRLNYIKENLK